MPENIYMEYNIGLREYSEKSEINDWFRHISRQVFIYLDPILIHISL